MMKRLKRMIFYFTEKFLIHPVLNLEIKNIMKISIKIFDKNFGLIAQ